MAADYYSCRPISTRGASRRPADDLGCACWRRTGRRNEPREEESDGAVALWWIGFASHRRNSIDQDFYRLLHRKDDCGFTTDKKNRHLGGLASWRRWKRRSFLAVLGTYQESTSGMRSGMMVVVSKQGQLVDTQMKSDRKRLGKFPRKRC